MCDCCFGLLRGLITASQTIKAKSTKYAVGARIGKDDVSGLRWRIQRAGFGRLPKPVGARFSVVVCPGNVVRVVGVKLGH